MIHYFKTAPEPFQAIVDNLKFHEVRRDDRPLRPRVRDVVALREYDPQAKAYTGREMLRVVTYVTAPGQWGLPSTHYVFSHLPFGGA